MKRFGEHPFEEMTVSRKHFYVAANEFCLRVACYLARGGIHTLDERFGIDYEYRVVDRREDAVAQATTGVQDAQTIIGFEGVARIIKVHGVHLCGEFARSGEEVGLEKIAGAQKNACAIRMMN